MGDQAHISGGWEYERAHLYDDAEHTSRLLTVVMATEKDAVLHVHDDGDDEP